MFKKIMIENFRGIRHIEIDNLERLNLFVGKNNSGKSSILEAIFLNIGAMNSELPLRINAFRNYDRIDDMTFRSFFYNLQIDHYIKISSEIDMPQQRRDLTIKAIYERQTNGKIIDIKDIPMGEHSSESKQVVVGLQHILKIREKGNGRGKEYKAFVKQKGLGAEIVQPNNYSESLFGVILAPRMMPKDNAKRLARIQFEKREKQLIEILREIEPLLLNVVILDNNYIFADIGKKNLIPFALLGDGINRLLTYLLAIYESPNSIVMIDEIENGFHHKSLEILWKAIFAASKELNVQIFATTHSWENVRTFANVAKEKNEESYKLFRIESAESKNEAIEYEPVLLQEALESEWEIR